MRNREQEWRAKQAKEKQEKAEKKEAERRDEEREVAEWGKMLEERYAITPDVLFPEGVDEVRVQVQPHPILAPDMWLTGVCWRPSTVERAWAFLDTCLRVDGSMGGFNLRDFWADERVRELEWAKSKDCIAMLEALRTCSPSSELFKAVESHFETPWVVMGSRGFKSFETPSFVFDSAQWTRRASGATFWHSLWALGRRDHAAEWGFHSPTVQHLAGSPWHVDRIS